MRHAALVRYRALPPSPLKGSFESLARQNERMEADGLERILDEDDLASRIEQKLLVIRLTETKSSDLFIQVSDGPGEATSGK